LGRGGSARRRACVGEGEVERFAAEVDAAYKRSAPDLAALGRRLYAWLDGPTGRWLEQARQGVPGLAVHVDVEERLRHLPWELMCDAGGFLCADPLRPFTPVRRVSGNVAIPSAPTVLCACSSWPALPRMSARCSTSRRRRG
jgi:hypothetical protein